MLPLGVLALLLLAPLVLLLLATPSSSCPALPRIGGAGLVPV